MISKIASHTDRHAALGTRMLQHTLPQDQLKNLFLQDFMYYHGNKSEKKHLLFYYGA